MMRFKGIWRRMRAQLGIGRTARPEGGVVLPKCALERLEPRVLLSAGLTAAINESLGNGAGTLSAPLGTTAIEVALNPAGLSDSTLSQASALSAGAGNAPGQGAEPDFLKLPLAFETNEGQTDPMVDFLARGSGYTVFLTDGDAVLRLDRDGASYAVRLELLGAADDPEAAGLGLLPGRSNYFLGNDPARWHTDIANYGSVEYTGVYDGVNVRYYGNQRQLEYDFLVAAGADPSVIRLAFQGAASVHVDESGGLVLQLSADGDHIRFHAPVSYQLTEGGQREMVASRYVIAADGTVGFEVGSYDTSRPLVIDPVLDYGTYLGGTGNDRGQVIRVDASGNIYIAGRTSSADFPFTGDAVDPTHNGNTDAFIVQLSPDGSTLLYSTFLGGSGNDQAFDIQIGSSGVIYVAGETMSSDFPTKSGTYGSTLRGASDGFVAKINPGQSNLIYSAFVGGDQDDACLALVVDAGGRAYVTGTTTSSSGFPITAGAWQSSLNGSSDLFLVGLSPSAAQLDYGTYLGGSGTAVERGNAIVMDGAGHVYLTGSTGAGDFPTTPGAYDTTFNGNADAFLLEFDPATSSMIYSTYLGGAGADEGKGIFRDGSGRIYLVGDTTSAAFPTTPGAYDRTYNGATDAFVVRFDVAYSLAYATYFGGTGSDYGNDIVVDAAGRVHFVGQTWSGNLPTTADAHQSVLRGPADAYVVVLDPAGATLVYSTYLGGWGIDAGMSIVLDSAANIYLTGYDDTGSLSTTPGAYDETHNGGDDAFVVRLTAVGSSTQPPYVDLDADDSSGAGGANLAVIFREGLGPVAVADLDALLSDLDSVNLVRLTVTITNLRDGAAESLSADTTGTSIVASYNSSTGVLTLSGVDTVAHYQQVLRTIRYNNTSANPDTTARIIRFVANDGSSDSNVATATVTIVAQNNAPSVDLDANDSSGAGGADYAALFREGLGPVTVADIDALLSDLDSANLVGLTVTITNLRDGAAESLSVDTTGTSIVASYDSGTGVLTLSGVDTLAHYQQVLRTIRYNNTSANPNTTARIIRFVANDGAADSNVATTTVTVVAQNNAPSVDLDADDSSGVGGADYAALFREGLGPVAITDTDALLSDLDDVNLVRLTVTITNLRDGAAESLSVNTTGTSIVASYDSVTGVLTLSGIDTVARYQQVLGTIRYNNTSVNPDTTARIIRFVANDGAADSNMATATVTVMAQNNAPSVDLDADNSSGAGGADFATIFREGLGPMGVADVDALLSDPDNINLVRLTATITNLRDGTAESLSVDTTGTSIVATYDSSTGVLTLSGVDTVAHYQQVLRTIRYNNASPNPDTTARIIRFVANDGSSDSNAATATVTVVARNDAPTLADIEGTPLPFTENDPASPVTGSVTLGDVDDTRIESATVRITGNYRNGEDVLDFVDTATITGRWDAATGTLTLTGSDSVANYQAALRSITYRNRSENPGMLIRTVTFTINDGTDNSNSLARSITITAVNDAPIMNDQVFQVVAWGEPGTVVGVITATDPDGTTVTYNITAGNTNGDLTVDPATGTITLNRAGTIGGGRETLIVEVEVTDDGTPALSRTAVMTIVVDFLPAGAIPPAPDEGEPQDNPVEDDPADDAGDDTDVETSPSETPATVPDAGREAGPARRLTASRGTHVQGLPPMTNFVPPTPTAGVPGSRVVHVSITAPVVTMGEPRWAEEATVSAMTRHAERLLPQLGTFIGEFHAQIIRKAHVQNARIGVTAALAGTVTVGYVIWLLRGGALLTAVLSSLPAWRFVDPLPVLDAWASRRPRQGRGGATGGGDEDETEQRVQSILE